MELPVLLPVEFKLVESPLLLLLPTFAARLPYKTQQNTTQMISIARNDCRNRDMLLFMIAQLTTKFLVFFSAFIKINRECVQSLSAQSALRNEYRGAEVIFSHFSWHDLPV